MDREKFINKYGKEKVVFRSYYKFSFNFVGTLQNEDRIRVTTGGNSDEIYREEVVTGEARTVSELEPYAGSIIRGEVEQCSFYDF